MSDFGVRQNHSITAHARTSILKESTFTSCSGRRRRCRLRSCATAKVRAIGGLFYSRSRQIHGPSDRRRARR